MRELHAAPGQRRRNLPGHTDEEMLRLEARRGIHAGMLPSNIARAEPVDGLTGGSAAPEGAMRGWTAQQPWTHVDCPVMHYCIMCAREVDPDRLRDHQCHVRAELEAA